MYIKIVSNRRIWQWELSLYLGTTDLGGLIIHIKWHIYLTNKNKVKNMRDQI